MSNQTTSTPWVAARSTIPAIDGSSRTGYSLNWPLAGLAAVLAAAAITAYMLVVPEMLGIEQMDIGVTVGRLFDFHDGPAALAMRVLWHVGNGFVYVFCYAAALLKLRQQSNILTGAVFGLILLIVGPMLLIPIGLNRFPAVASGQLTNPGIFMLDLNLGWLPFAIDLGAHLIHGVIVGVIYKHRVS